MLDGERKLQPLSLAAKLEIERLGCSSFMAKYDCTTLISTVEKLFILFKVLAAWRK